MTTDRTDRYSRRALLKGMGLGMGLLPLLNSEKVIAQNAGVAKRFISITWTNGIVPKDFYPAAGAITTLPPILSPLETWKSKILALRGKGTGGNTGGVDVKVMNDAGKRFDGHNAYPSLLTGSFQAATASIDTLIGDQLKKDGFAAPQLNLAVKAGNSCTSWRAGKVKNTPETDPYRLYTRLFAGISATPGATPAVDPLLARRKSVIDYAIKDITNFSARLGTDDKAKINAHLDSVREIEKQLMAPSTPVGAGCKPPPNTPTGLNVTQSGAYPDVVKLMMDIIAAAVKCDVARTFTLDLIDDGGGNSLTFPTLGLASPDFHAIAHQGSAGYTNKTKIDTFYYSQIANLVGQLAANPEGSATSLDNSVILVSNDMSEGSFHDVLSLPYLIIGSGGGFFKQGTCVQFPANVANNQLLTSICHACGLQVASVGSTYTGDLDSMLKA